MVLPGKVFVEKNQECYLMNLFLRISYDATSSSVLEKAVLMIGRPWILWTTLPYIKTNWCTVAVSKFV